MSKDEIMERQLKAIIARWGVEDTLLRMANIVYQREYDAIDNGSEQIEREKLREESFAMARAVTSFQEDYPERD